MIFKVKDGCFGYRNSSQILQDISISIKPGDITAILGPNGAGKTTMLKCMIGLLKWTSGASYIDDVPITNMPQTEFWRKVGYVPQAKLSALAYTVTEMVLLGRSTYVGTFGQPGDADYLAVAESLEMIGISHMRDKMCSRISGGELQMVLLARALAANPEMLVLDEPESNLDFKNQLVVLETMARLVKQKNIACIFNTHYPSHALSVSKYSLLLNKHGKALFGESEEVINEDNMRSAFHVNVHINSLHVDNRCHKSVLALSIV